MHQYRLFTIHVHLGYTYSRFLGLTPFQDGGCRGRYSRYWILIVVSIIFILEVHVNSKGGPCSKLKRFVSLNYSQPKIKPYPEVFHLTLIDNDKYNLRRFKMG